MWYIGYTIWCIDIYCTRKTTQCLEVCCQLISAMFATGYCDFQPKKCAQLYYWRRLNWIPRFHEDQDHIISLPMKTRCEKSFAVYLLASGDTCFWLKWQANEINTRHSRHKCYWNASGLSFIGVWSLKTRNQLSHRGYYLVIVVFGFSEEKRTKPQYTVAANIGSSRLKLGRQMDA